jgi:hypothetical protein
MKNKFFVAGILALVLVFGMTVVGCDDGSTDGNGGGTDYWAQFKNTDWVKGSIRITFRESSQGKFMNFTGGPLGYRMLSTVEANKFISLNGTNTIDYVLSNNGQTLTLSNGSDSDWKAYEGEYAKQ